MASKFNASKAASTLRHSREGMKERTDGISRGLRPSSELPQLMGKEIVKTNEVVLDLLAVVEGLVEEVHDLRQQLDGR